MSAPKKSHGGARKGAGRPKATDPRDQLVKVYLTTDEREAVAALAEEHGFITISEWIRERALTTGRAQK